MAKKETKSDFDLQNTLKALECPDMFKAGLISYIERNNLKINNITQFKKIVKEYSEVKL